MYAYTMRLPFGAARDTSAQIPGFRVVWQLSEGLVSSDGYATTRAAADLLVLSPLFSGGPDADIDAWQREVMRDQWPLGAVAAIGPDQVSLLIANGTRVILTAVQQPPYLDMEVRSRYPAVALSWFCQELDPKTAVCPPMPELITIEPAGTYCPPHQVRTTTTRTPRTFQPGPA